MKTTAKYLSLAIASTFLAACGGAGTPGTTASTGTLFGTVPGTKIEAFCDNGSYYVTHSDKTKGTTTTPPRHPFSLTVPAGVGCHIVMTMNDDDPAVTDVVQSIGFKNKAGITQTRLVLGPNDKADVGNVPLLATQTAAATAGLDNNGDGILDTPFILDEHSAEGAKNPLKTVDADSDGVDDFDDSDGGGHNLDIANGDKDAQDPDGNGIPNVYDKTGTPPLSSAIVDTDEDGLPDSIDVNPDNKKDQNNALANSKDGYLDSDKNHDGFPDTDSNHDGKNDHTGKDDNTSLDG